MTPHELPWKVESAFGGVLGLMTVWRSGEHFDAYVRMRLPWVIGTSALRKATNEGGTRERMYAVAQAILREPALRKTLSVEEIETLQDFRLLETHLMLLGMR